MKHLAAVILVLVLTGSAGAVTSNYQEWWWNPALNGMGWNVGQQEDTVFVAWYHYDGARRPTFLYMAGALSNGQVTGTLFRPNGPPPQNYNPSSFGNVAVGNATLRFTAPNRATFSYNFDSQSGFVTLERFTFNPMDLSGVWNFVANGESTGCTIGSNNGTFVSTGTITISQTDSDISLTESIEGGGTCSYSLTATQNGITVDAPGTFTCDFGVSGTANLTNIRLVDDFLSFGSETQVTSGETCNQQNNVGSVPSAGS